MLVRNGICAAIACVAVSAANAGVGCETTSIQALNYYMRVVDSLRPEKPGQMRVFAADGSEFTAGQAQWMKVQLRKVGQLCARDSAVDRAEAAKSLTAVEDLLRSHQRRS